MYNTICSSFLSLQQPLFLTTFHDLLYYKIYGIINIKCNRIVSTLESWHTHESSSYMDSQSWRVVVG